MTIHVIYDIILVQSNEKKEGVYMAQTNLTIRIDEDVKRDAETLFNKIGMNMSTAINIFFRQSIRNQKIPFELMPYDDDYYTNERMKRILHSVEQAEKSEIITKTFAELETMAND